MKKYLKTFFSFSRKELNGLLVLLSLLLLLILFHPLNELLAPPHESDFSAFEKQLSMLDKASADSSGFTARETGTATGESPAAGAHPADSGKAVVLSPFNPNTASEQTLLRLGLKQGLVRTLLNYREAGGRFFRKEDLQKVYGLGQAEYARLAPYVRLDDTARARYTKMRRDARTPRHTRLRHDTLEVNSADSAELIALPGIGETLSARIVRFRERIGGFHSLQQLLQVYGLDSSNFLKAVPFLRIDTSLVRKVNLNQAGYDELSRLPYWSPVQINAVLNYRDQRNGFTEINDLYHIRALEDSTIQKVIPYLSLR